MSNVVNDRDNLLINAGSRINSSGVGVIVVPSSNAVKIATNGTATPSTVTFTATKLSVSGTITWSIVGGVLSGTAENIRTLNVTDMTADTATVTVKVAYGGVEHSNSTTVHKVRDGVVAYTWIKYADSATGSGLSDDPTGKTYIGLAHNKSTATESTLASDYTWSLIKGTDGVKGDSSYTWIKYSDNADGTGLYDVPTNNTVYIGIATNKTTATESTNKADYVWSRFRGSDGVPGTNGSRGAGHYYTTGSVWSDAAADNATPGGNVVDDVVTISNGTNFVMEKKWSGSAWIAMGTVIDGSLIVTNSITASKINTNGLTVRDTNGNAILDIGGLRAGFEAPNTKNSDFQNGTLTVGGDNLADNSSFERASGGMAVGFSVYNNNTSAEPSTVSDGVGRSGSGRSQIVSWTGGHNWQKGIVGTVCRGGWVPNRTYVVSIWAKTTSLLTAGGLTLEWNSVPANTVALLNPNLSTSWQRYVWRITWGSSVEASGRAYISVHLGSGAGNVHFDDLMVVEGEVLPAYAPSVTEAARYASWPNVDGEGRPSDNASADLVLIGRGVAINGNTLTRTQSGTGWGQADCYSKDCYTGGAFVTGVLTDLSAGVMIGLNNNADADNDAHYTTINYAIYGATSPGGAIEIYEHGNYVATGATWAVGDVLGVFYDGSNVRYTKNGIELRKVAASAGLSMFFDSSFITQGRNITNVRFGPMSDNSAGVTANAAIPGINNAIADKLSKTSASSLAATVTLSTGGSILAGTTTNGTYHSPSGFYGVQGGVIKFSVPISGDPTFAGQLTAAYGTFGGLRIASGGYIAQGAYTGSWSWPSASEAGGFLIHANGMLIGNANNPNMSFIYIDAANGRLAMPGFDYSGRQLTLTNPVLIDPQMNTFTVTIVNTSGQYYWSVPRNTNGAWAGAYSATASGQTGSEIYNWRVESFSGIARAWLSTTTTKQVELYVYGNGFLGEAEFQLICTVTRNGLSSTKAIGVTVNFT